MQPGLPPELDALKNTIRQIVRDECVPLEQEYLTHPPLEGRDDGGPGGSPKRSRESSAACPGITGTG